MILLDIEAEGGSRCFLCRMGEAACGFPLLKEQSNLMCDFCIMKVVQVVPGIAHESSGVSYTMLSICKGLYNSGCDVLLCATGLPKGIVMPYKMVECPTLGFPDPRLGRSPEMYKLLKKECQSSNIIHSNSLWMMPNIYPHFARRGTQCKLVTQPHGTLSKYALSRSRVKKFIVGVCGQYSALRATDMWVATAESEYEDIRQLGYKQPIAILPNGIDVPDIESFPRITDTSKRRRMLFISRIHPKKNVGMLIDCWARLEHKFTDWDLAIVGPYENNSYAVEMMTYAKDLGCRRVSFEGEINGKAKYIYMSNSDCVILPTHSENFGMVVAEALACGTPVICSHGAPWEGLNLKTCGWWVATDQMAIEHAMREAMSKTREELKVMGGRGRVWMKQDFDWDAIGLKMRQAYEWLTEPCKFEKPECVRVD